jgi:hypothetical protein
MNIQTTENWRIFWGVHLELPIGGVIAERKFVPLCLFVNTSPVNLAVANGNGNMYFKQTKKLHVQMANSH